MDAFRKPRPGDPLRIPAKAYSAFVDAALAHQQQALSRTSGPLKESAQGNVVLVKNESGSARNRFDVLGITGPIFKPSDSAVSFKSRITLRGVVPTSSHVGRFAILIEPVPAGTIGRAVIAGVSIARVRMADEGHVLADIEDGNAAQLLSAESGSASLLWVEPVGDRDDPSVAWCITRFGGGGTYSLGNNFIPALLSQVQQFSGAVTGLPAYAWDEAEIDSAGAAQVKSGGIAGGNIRATVSLYDTQLFGSGTAPNAPSLTFPAIGISRFTATPAGGDVTLTVAWSGGSGNTKWQIYLGSTAPESQEDTDAYDLYYSGDLSSATDDVDFTLGDTVYLTVFGTVDNWANYVGVRYAVTIEEVDSRAIATEDVTTIDRGDSVEAPAEYDNSGSTWIPSAWTNLDTPILVMMFRTTDADGNDRYLFTRGGGGGAGAEIVLGSETYHQFVADFNETTCALTLKWFGLKSLTVDGMSSGYVITQVYDTDPNP